ncbi:PucR family transcriptional regulator [Microbacterium aoyamense]|nr:PucR family transcriptional regulator [Microbacterium aoyamense]
MVTLPRGTAAPALVIRACSIVEPQDQGVTRLDRSDEVVLLIGQTPDHLASGLENLAASRPALVMVKMPDTVPVEDLAVRAGIAHIARVNPEVPWGQLHALVERMITSAPEPEVDPPTGIPERSQVGDLFAIANSLADQINGYVSIDDMQSRVLAFSPLDEHADQLRRDSILGRGAPPGHREQLRAQGVWDELRRPGRVLEFGRDGDTMPRLAAGMVDERTQRQLGTIWVQQGAMPFAARARQILSAGATLAARAILRADRVESRDTEALLQLIGLRRSTESRRTLAAILGLEDSRTWMLVAFELASDDVPAEPFSAPPAAVIALHAAVIRQKAQVAISQSVAYVIIPDPPAPSTILPWAERTSAALSAQLKVSTRCAVGPSVENPRELPLARETVDTMLKKAAAEGAIGIITYESRRANLQVSRAVQALWERGLLTGEPVDAVLASSYVDGRELLHTIDVYFREARSPQRASRALHLHPNTLRQRLRRIERVTGLHLDDDDERLLLELEVRAYVDGLARDAS